MSIYFYCSNDSDGQIVAALRQALPATQIQIYPETHAETVTDAVVWNAPADFFDGLPPLRAVLSVAAGVDHLLDHPGLPSGVPLYRLQDAGMGEKMAEFVLFGVLHAQRQMTAFKLAQARGEWADHVECKHAREFNVGIMGLGAMGGTCATRLLLNGYSVSAWTRRQRSVSELPETLAKVSLFDGKEGLQPFLSQLDALVCLLPLTAATAGTLNAELFARLPDGCFLINAGRGQHQVQDDVLAALDSGKLSGALLDVTQPEPLPSEHALWRHPRVVLTPHVAAPTQIAESVAQIAANIARLDSGSPGLGAVDTARGY